MSNFLITNLLIFIPLVGSLTIGIFKNKLSEKFVTFFKLVGSVINNVKKTQTVVLYMNNKYMGLVTIIT